MGSSTTLKTQVKHLLRNPVFSPTAKQLQSSLNVIERTSGRLVVSRGGRVFMIVRLPRTDAGGWLLMKVGAEQDETNMSGCSAGQSLITKTR